MLTYTERLDARARRWWGSAAGAPSLRPSSVADRLVRHLRQPHPLHRLRELLELRHRDDPEEHWHCCRDWQRTLGNKWNSREFALRHGCRVPELYWSGWRLSTLPWDRLPNQYAIRPSFSGGRMGTYLLLDGRDLLRGGQHTPASLTRELRHTHRWRWLRPTLVEEFVRTESGAHQLPIEYKWYMFGETVGAIEIDDRRGTATTQVFYTADWTRMADRMVTKYPAGDDVDPPACLPEMLSCARRLGVAYGTHVRVDFYASDRGSVFSEFSNRPNTGKCFTPHAQQYLGELWETAFSEE